MVVLPGRTAGRGQGADQLPLPVPLSMGNHPPTEDHHPRLDAFTEASAEA